MQLDINTGATHRQRIPILKTIMWATALLVILWNIWQAFLLIRYEFTPWVQYVLGGAQ